MGYFVGLRLAAHDFFFVVRKGAEKAESAPFWIRGPNERPGFRRGVTGFGGFQ